MRNAGCTFNFPSKVEEQLYADRADARHAGSESRTEKPGDEASTEAGKVTAIDEKGPKVCAADEPAATAKGDQQDGD